jgi:hypothetical protein
MLQLLGRQTVQKRKKHEVMGTHHWEHHKENQKIKDARLATNSNG